MFATCVELAALVEKAAAGHSGGKGGPHTGEGGPHTGEGREVEWGARRRWSTT
jgi:hypothetical protein